MQQIMEYHMELFLFSTLIKYQEKQGYSDPAILIHMELEATQFLIGTIHLLRHHIFGIFGPPSPLRQHVFSTKNKQKLTFSDHPSPPTSADVIYEWSPALFVLAILSKGILNVECYVDMQFYCFNFRLPSNSDDISARRLRNLTSQVLEKTQDGFISDQATLHTLQVSTYISYIIKVV